MNGRRKREISVEIKSQKILFSISIFASAYLIYFGINNPKWIYYCSIVGAYLLTRSLCYGVKWYKNKNY